MLRQVVREHFETFRSRVVAQGDGRELPQFVERAFRDFLTCGTLAGGFARFRCAACGYDRLVAFSCKGRGLCPSCGGRRMTERAAHLVDRVFPDVPVRQWVLTLPPRVRYLVAWDHALCRAVVQVYMRAVLGWLRQQARQRGVSGGRGGAVAIVQRFGSALNLNVHVHALVLDGVYAPGRGGQLRFRRTPAAEPGEVAALAGTIARRVERLLARRGLGDGDDAGPSDGWAEDEPMLAGLSAAAVQGVAALGPRRGMPARRWGDAIDLPEPPVPGPWWARHDRFDLHAAVVVRAGARAQLERVCRYALRPPVGQDRLQPMPDGTVVLELPRRWRDGTTHLIFDPLELLERLAALVPRPRVNLVLYYGVLAPRAAWRQQVVPDVEAAEAARESAEADPKTAETVGRAGRAPNRTWAELMQRSFGFDVLACPRCAGRLTLVALIHTPVVIERILDHLGLPVERPAFVPARDPPLVFEDADEHSCLPG